MDPLHLTRLEYLLALSQTGGQGTAGQSVGGYGWTRCFRSVSILILVASISLALISGASSSVRPPSVNSVFRRRSASSERRGSVLPRHCHKTVRSLQSAPKHTP